MVLERRKEERAKLDLGIFGEHERETTRPGEDAYFYRKYLELAPPEDKYRD